MASVRYHYVWNSTHYHQGHLDPEGKKVARDFLKELDRETPNLVFYKWAMVRKAGEESKLYSPEIRRTLIGLLERWSDEKAMKQEFSFLVLDGRWHIYYLDERRLPTEPVVEGMKMWLEKRRRLGKRKCPPL